MMESSDTNPTLSGVSASNSVPLPFESLLSQGQSQYFPAFARSPPLSVQQSRSNYSLSLSLSQSFNESGYKASCTLFCFGSVPRSISIEVLYYSSYISGTVCVVANCPWFCVIVMGLRISVFTCMVLSTNGLP
jgi:hypothetical protein